MNCVCARATVKGRTVEVEKILRERHLLFYKVQFTGIKNKEHGLLKLRSESDKEMVSQSRSWLME